MSASLFSMCVHFLCVGMAVCYYSQQIGSWRRDDDQDKRKSRTIIIRTKDGKKGSVVLSVCLSVCSRSVGWTVSVVAFVNVSTVCSFSCGNISSLNWLLLVQLLFVELFAMSRIVFLPFPLAFSFCFVILSFCRTTGVSSARLFPLLQAVIYFLGQTVTLYIQSHPDGWIDRFGRVHFSLVFSPSPSSLRFLLFPFISEGLKEDVTNTPSLLNRTITVLYQ